MSDNKLKNLSAKSASEKHCDHGVSFDEDAFRQRPDMSTTEVRKRWPRLFGACPKGCGFDGIGYASKLHFVVGDW